MKQVNREVFTSLTVDRITKIDGRYYRVTRKGTTALVITPYPWYRRGWDWLWKDHSWVRRHGYDDALFM